MRSLSFRLTSLPAGIFNKLVNLQRLDIEGNPDLQVLSDLFEPLISLSNLHTDVPFSLPKLAVSPGSVLHGRTMQVAAAILNQLPGITRVNQVTNPAQLSGIASLSLSNLRLISVRADDFEGLTNLRTLNLQDNRLTSLPAGIFDELANLQMLNLQGNQFSFLPSGIFHNLPDSLSTSLRTQYAQYFRSPYISLSSSALRINERGNQFSQEEVYAEFQVQLRNAPYSEDITFDYTTQDGTATAGQDYIVTSGTISKVVGYNSVEGLIEGSSAQGEETLGLVGFGTPAVR